MQYQWQDSLTATDITTLHVGHELVASEFAGDDLLSSLLEVPGVASASVNRYTITVTKGRLFSWNDLKPAIIRLADESCDDPTPPEMLP